MKISPTQRFMAWLGTTLDHRFGWPKLPKYLGLLAMSGMRTKLRHENLFDTGSDPSPLPVNERWQTARSYDGSYNDLAEPKMGSYGARFGRNVPIARTFPQGEVDLMKPNPRRVSRELLTRDTFIPATAGNVLISAWLQFEVHDWFSHGKNLTENPWKVELGEGDDWHDNPMLIQRTRPDPTFEADGGNPPTYRTDDSHWWDGSQIYGSGAQMADFLRGEDGTMRLDPDGLPPADAEAKIDLSGPGGNFWLGLGLLHTVFTQEHNSIAAMLRTAHPEFSDNDVYDKARLINAALMAKIHTVEWTPAVIAHPTTVKAMHSNWWGVVGEKVTRRFGRLSPSELVSGIPGSPKDHHGVPYSLTEEFVAVYRMHALLPDDYELRTMKGNAKLADLGFRDIGALDTRRLLQEHGVTDWLYSFGLGHPGIVCLHNYPRSLQHFDRPDGTTIDLASIDILRVRERGVPRYNEMRRLLHMKPKTSFDDLTSNPEWASQLRDVYDDDLEAVDLMVGNYAEDLPPGFAFSDTAFRVFVLMASRRLKSDRFFTDDYRPEVYTEEGLRWVNENSMKSVLLRHFPDLAPAMRGIDNAFAAWKPVG